MNSQDVKTVNEKVAVLIGQPLRSVERYNTVFLLYFGELVESKLMYRNENGKTARDEKGYAVYKKCITGKYGIDVVCSIRLTKGDKIVLGKRDVFLPKKGEDTKDDFDWNTFDWDVYGNNLFDELVECHITCKLQEFIVKSVKAGKFGDLKIAFNNGYTLELFGDGSGYTNNWCLFDAASDDNLLVVTGYGVELDEADTNENKAN